MKHYYFLGSLNEVFEREDNVDLSIFPQYVPLTKEQITYYKNHPSATRYEIKHYNDTLPELTLDETKQNKIWDIELYDSSSAVNEFFINNQSMWLDKQTRTSLNFSLLMEESVGRTESTLWVGDLCFTLPIDQFKMMLSALEVYAKDCYNITAMHKSNINSLSTKEDVENYDIAADYPEKLYFNI